MASKSPFSPVVIRKLAPALVVVLFIFLASLFLISYTNALFLVIILWIAVPVMAVKLWRRLNDMLSRRN